MLAGSERRGSNFHVVVGVAIYAFFLVTAPFEHHDLVCHFKTPTHCSSCTSSLVGAHPHTPAGVGAADLPYAGGAFAVDIDADGSLLAVRSTGRSPPAAV